MLSQTLSIPGKIAYVTGGGSGIGAAIANALAGTGLAVAVIDKNRAGADGQVARIRSSGGTAAAFEADVSAAADVRRAVAEARVQLGDPYHVVNCAGIYPRSEVEKMEEAEWDRVLDTNLKGAFLMCREAVPLMTGGGRVLAITSELGNTGSAAGAHYAASKAGLNGLMRSLAKEVAGRGISVNCIAPGLTDTPMMRGANDPQYIEAVAARQPGGRLGQPEDVVGLVLFLLSEAGALITGQVLNLR